MRLIYHTVRGEMGRGLLQESCRVVWMELVDGSGNVVLWKVWSLLILLVVVDDAGFQTGLELRRLLSLALVLVPSMLAYSNSKYDVMNG